MIIRSGLEQPSETAQLRALIGVQAMTKAVIGFGGSGGSGIVIVSYPDIYAPLTTGGATSPTVSTSGSGRPACSKPFAASPRTSRCWITSREGGSSSA